MKKWIAVCSAMSALTGVAHAQSTVTLYGVIDQGVNMITNVGGGRV